MSVSTALRPEQPVLPRLELPVPSSLLEAQELSVEALQLPPAAVPGPEAV